MGSRCDDFVSLASAPLPIFPLMRTVYFGFRGSLDEAHQAAVRVLGDVFHERESGYYGRYWCGSRDGSWANEFARVRPNWQFEPRPEDWLLVSPDGEITPVIPEPSPTVEPPKGTPYLAEHVEFEMLLRLEGGDEHTETALQRSGFTLLRVGAPRASV